MNVGLLLISHQGVASNLLTTANNMLGNCPTNIRVLEVPLDASLEDSQQQANAFINQLNQGDGVLILTDLYGSTPSNVGHVIIDQVNTKMVSGLNLPMLVKVLNYPNLDLEEMAAKAQSGGQAGILLCDCK
ncbi:MAG: PTS fructose transporter subunit IIA [Gammaproteobacteria bacterium]|nr:PTS fructose transporter subunit IIA [Gammaproteobacteria bacterium]